MAQKKPAAKKKSGAKKPTAKRARNKDGTYKGDDKSTPDVNEAYEKPKPGTKATTKPRNPVAKQREASTTKKPAAKKAPAKKPVAKKPVAKKPAQKQRNTYAPKVVAKDTVSREVDTQPTPRSSPKPPPLSRHEPPAKKKSRAARIWVWFVGQ
tara:strand:- start:1461 stop:1919 length:459 start_codon:yes stop_codon:yes gene_type:complete